MVLTIDVMKRYTMMGYYVYRIVYTKFNAFVVPWVGTTIHLTLTCSCSLQSFFGQLTQYTVAFSFFLSQTSHNCPASGLSPGRCMSRSFGVKSKALLKTLEYS